MMSFRTTVSVLGRNTQMLNVTTGSRFGCHKSCVSPSVATVFYSQDVHSNIPPVDCPMHNNNTDRNSQPNWQEKRRNKSTMVGTVKDIDITATQAESTQPFNEIPIPGGHEKGLMGILAPLYHAWRGKAFTKPHEYLFSCAKECGPIFRQNTLMGWVVNISDADGIEKVFRAVGKYPNRPMVKSWIEHRHDRNFALGIITSEHETWQRLRSAVSKGILKPGVLVSHVGSMHEVTLDLINKLRSIRKPDGVIPDIETELFKWAMESSATFVFDKRLNLITEKVLKKENQDFFDALQVIALESSKLWSLPEKVINNLPESRNPILKSNKAWDVLFAITKTYIDEKMGALARKADNGEDFDDGTFVAYMLTQNEITTEEIYGNVSEIFPASVDTTAHTTAWLIHEVSKHPEVQDKLYDELISINPENTTPTSEMLDSMTYLKATVKETQRLYPITLATARILDNDIVIKGYNIPKETHITTNFYTASRDPKLFDNPNEFKPERWLQNEKKYHPFASLPFGHGTRMCVGRRLAQQEMYLVLSELVRNFRLVSTKPNVGSNCGVTIHPESSVEPKLIDRRK
ncbi:1,25-dihydroxyvitamin D(3) 24-hydroxylase, mitochondrial-like [Amphiura filiformis]|uniref:1,25-dihydroxyvitamin D(3) 24-hydroxylase, mitochondrial-like n=1 Tax=Amphiura filiformis TaxID=82378 RepID=UPI003B21B2D2